MPPAEPSDHVEKTPPRRRLPRWLKREAPLGAELTFTDRLVSDLGLETVCREARCPNRCECWSLKTATFMVLGRVCTRSCGFCAVQAGKPAAPAEDEPERVAEATMRLGLRHVVLTAVTRDDLPDGGAEHFARCVRAVHERAGASVEVLTSDLGGDHRALDALLAAEPEVLGHNLETVVRLQRSVRRKATYETSLEVLRYAKARRPQSVTKSGLLLGLGETVDELLDTLADLRRVDCNLLTMGQYLRPSPQQLPVARFLPPEEFAELGHLAEQMGFDHVASAPFVRSSYHAEEGWRIAANQGDSLACGGGS